MQRPSPVALGGDSYLGRSHTDAGTSTEISISRAAVLPYPVLIRVEVRRHPFWELPAIRSRVTTECHQPRES